MKLFLFDPLITNPLYVARRDHMEYFVEDIFDHRGKHQRTHVEVLVKWLNYPSDKNTWEPYCGRERWRKGSRSGRLSYRGASLEAS